MKKEIENRIIELGGVCNFRGESLKDDLLSISFEKPFLVKDYGSFILDTDGMSNSSGISSYQTFQQKLIEGGAVPYHKVPSSFFEFKTVFYTPFMTDSKEYDEYALDDKIADDVRAITKSNNLEFVVIGHHGAWEQYFVCLEDENCKNPTVYHHDLESPFSDVYVHGSLEDFFNYIMTEKEYLSDIAEWKAQM